MGSSLRGLLFAAALVAPLAAPIARAQPAEEDAGAADEEYGRWVDLAIEEFAAHRYPESLAAFRRAHSLRPSARTLRGMAMASYETRNYAFALRCAEAALADEVQPLTPDLRAHVQDIATRSRAFVGVFVLVLSPSDAELRVDSAAELWDHHEGRLILGLGEHRVRLTAEGYEPLERALTVVGGEDETLRLDMSPVAAPAAVVLPPAPAAPLRLPDPDPPDHARRDAGLALLVAGIALALGGVAGIAWIADREGTLSDCRSALAVDPVRCANFDALQVERDTSIGVTIGLGSAGLGLVGAGLAILFSE
ncbi:MAG: hypothetical protein KC619_19050 [Myxococcales bacterium]|nr:hypothetical protein [Myxococcales bacterium]